MDKSWLGLMKHIADIKRRYADDKKNENGVDDNDS